MIQLPENTSAADTCTSTQHNTKSTNKQHALSPRTRTIQPERETQTRTRRTSREVKKEKGKERKKRRKKINKDIVKSSARQGNSPLTGSTRSNTSQHNASEFNDFSGHFRAIVDEFNDFSGQHEHTTRTRHNNDHTHTQPTSTVNEFNDFSGRDEHKLNEFNDLSGRHEHNTNLDTTTTIIRPKRPVRATNEGRRGITPRTLAP